MAEKYQDYLKERIAKAHSSRYTTDEMAKLRGYPNSRETTQQIPKQTEQH